MSEFGDAAPAVDEFVLIVYRFGEAEDGGFAVGEGRSEEGAAAFGAEQLVQGEIGNNLTFVVIPEFHGEHPIRFEEPVLAVTCHAARAQLGEFAQTGAGGQPPLGNLDG